MWDQQSLRSACACTQSDQSLCQSLEYSMSVKLLTEHRLEFVSLKGGCTGLSESTLVKNATLLEIICRGSILASSRCTYDTLGTLISQSKGQIQTSTTNLVFMHAVRRFMLEFIEIVLFFMQLGNHFCVLSPLSCVKAMHRVLPES